MKSGKFVWKALVVAAILAVSGWAGRPVGAQVVPPDTTVCDDVDACEVPQANCTPAGYVFKLKEYVAAPAQNSGSATYTYEICNPTAGTCVGEKAGTSCQSNEQCWDTCKNNGKCAVSGEDCTLDSQCNDPMLNSCSGKTVNGVSTECVPDSIKGLGLSHFDISFPALGASCLGENTMVTGSCSASGGAMVGNFVLGDGSCFEGSSPVAKCDSTALPPGGCITMTLTIPGELNKPGLGTAVVVDKEGPNCEASCLAGPSCDGCGDEVLVDDWCITRTLGFWGTHPWITNDYELTGSTSSYYAETQYANSPDHLGLTVCGHSLGCDGADDGKSNPSCGSGSCNDVMEGLGSIGKELSKESAYVALIKQLTAAKLNLAATAHYGATTAVNAPRNPAEICSDFRYPAEEGQTIRQWLTLCENLCNASSAMISSSGCIEALDAFNNSQDTAPTTPAPFDRPPVDDHGNISGADPSAFGAAQGGKKGTNLVIGKNISPNMCMTP